MRFPREDETEITMRKAKQTTAVSDKGMRSLYTVFAGVALFFVILFGIGAYINRPINTEDPITSYQNQKLRILIYSNDNRFDPEPFRTALKKHVDHDVFNFDDIPNSMKQSDIIVQFLTSWDRSYDMKVDLDKDTKWELSNTADNVYSEMYRMRDKIENRYLDVIFFNRSAAGDKEIPLACFARMTNILVTNFGEPFDMTGCIENN